MLRLNSGELRVQAILKPTKAKFFTDLHVGDSLGVIHELRSTTGASGGGKYASYYKVMCYNRGTSITLTGNELIHRLDNFSIESI